MKTHLHSTLLKTAIIKRDQMAIVCEADPLGEFHVKGQTIRTNRDRLQDLEDWIVRLMTSDTVRHLH